MAAETEQAYRFDPLDGYGFRERFLIRAADLAFFFAISIIGRTIRWEKTDLHFLDEIAADNKHPIFCLWHDRIFAGTYFLRDRGIVVITSQSRDGEYIARFLKRFGFGTIRGSSSRGGVKALVEMIRAMRRGLPMAFTVDGPRGPRYEAKKGAVLLAKKTSNPMVPFSLECKKFWTVQSWDRMQIPKPFTRARFLLGEPIPINGEADDEAIERGRYDLQASLENLVRSGEAWRNDQA